MDFDKKLTWSITADLEILCKLTFLIFIFRYKIDFELFGYDAEDYIKMGKPGLDDLSKEKVKEDENLEKTAENPIE